MSNYRVSGGILPPHILGPGYIVMEWMDWPLQFILLEASWQFIWLSKVFSTLINHGISGSTGKLNLGGIRLIFTFHSRDRADVTMIMTQYALYTWAIAVHFFIAQSVQVPGCPTPRI